MGLILAADYLGITTQSNYIINSNQNNCVIKASNILKKINLIFN